MKIMSWNVNGIRAIAKKGFHEFLVEKSPDVLCIQETKAQMDNLTDHHTNIDGYEAYFHSAEKKGYSGVAIYSKKEPLAIIEGMGDEEFDMEGRVITAEYEKFFVVGVYVPNAQPELARIKYRENFNDALKKFCLDLEKKYKKAVILCGDLNVAHNEIDLTHPKPNRGNAGFSDEERAKLNELLDAGYVDTFRTMHPETIKYSWWSYRMKARERNVGWRIDYVLVSKNFMKNVSKAEIHNDVLGSDHCPVSITVK